MITNVKDKISGSVSFEVHMLINHEKYNDFGIGFKTEIATAYWINFGFHLIVMANAQGLIEGKCKEFLNGSLIQEENSIVL